MKMKKQNIKHKHFFLRVMNVCLFIGICAGYQSIALVRAQKEAQIQKESQSVQASWKDGTYTGSGQGFGGNIVVQVVIEEGSIRKIYIIEAKGEDTAYLDQAKKIIHQMLNAQTWEVDTASGATYSSNGIREAVQNALKEAF